MDSIRFLLAAEMVALAFSPVLANLIELLIVVLVPLSAQARSRLASIAGSPPVGLTLAFVALLTLGAFYSMAPPESAFGMVAGWRKILLLPLALAVFDTPAAKTMLVRTLLAAMAFFVLLSYALALFGTLYFGQTEIGVVVRNHATQGILFSVAAFAAACLLLYRQTPLPRWLLGSMVALWLGNIVFVTPGRSGYVVFLVLGLAFAVGAAMHLRVRAGKAWGAAVLALLVGGSLLWLSPVAHQRILVGVHEMRDYRQAENVTSIGIRMHMWRNTLALVAERPWFGAGTGAFGTAYAAQIAGKAGVEGSNVAADPHNQYLNIAGENGLVGLLVFLALLLALFRQPATMPFRLLGVGVLAAWCVTSLANSHFGTFSEGRFIFLWVGAMLAPLRTKT